MKNRYYNIIIIFFMTAVISFAAGCDQGGAFDLTKDVNGQLENNDVYIVGISNASTSPSPCWTLHSGIKTDLGNINNNPLIFVKNGDIYVAGTDSNYQPCYWKNGVKTILSTPAATDSIHYASIRGLYVNDSGVVYVGGSCWDSSPALWACYWIGGARTDIKPVTATTSNSYGAYFDGTNVYIAGTYYVMSDGKTHYGYWKNTTFNEIGNNAGTGPSFTPKGITVSGGTVYVCGAYNDTLSTSYGAYWNSSTSAFTTLQGAVPNTPSGPVDHSICVIGTDVYVIGILGYNTSTSSTACYWKNGNIVMLSSDQSGSSNIFPLGSSIYISGRTGSSPNRNAVYWRDGNLVNLNISGTDTVAKSIFVLPK